jgi:hypothetical protein
MALHWQISPRLQTAMGAWQRGINTKLQWQCDGNILDNRETAKAMLWQSPQH